MILDPNNCDPTVEMEAPTAAPNLNSVPTEILLYILSILPSRALLPVLPVNRRFYSAAIRILHTRMTKAATLPDHRLILECYHPSAKISTPYLYCDYLSTDPLHIDQQDYEETGAGQQDKGSSSGAGLPRPTLGDLGNIYAHFRPVVQEENWRPRRRYPRRAPATQPASTNDIGGGGGGGESSQIPQEQDPEIAIPTQDIYLDENQLFSQLCTITNLVRLGPKPGLFISHVNVSDGIIRVWREWLGRQAAALAASSNNSNNTTTTGETLWADAAKNVGLRFRVAEKGVPQSEYNRRVPVLMAVDEEPPVAYRLELEELVVKASHLLLGMEKSELQEISTSGSAGLFFEPSAGPCPAQYFYWVNFQQFEDQSDSLPLEMVGTGSGIYGPNTGAGGLPPGGQHNLPVGMRRVSRWVPVTEVLGVDW